jgi:hypothetical protein
MSAPSVCSLDSGWLTTCLILRRPLTPLDLGLALSYLL